MGFETFLRVGIDASGARSGAREFKNSTNSVKTSADQAALASQKFNKQLAIAKTALLGFGVGAVAYATREIAKFSTAMHELKAITNTSGAQFDALSKKARDLGATTKFSATEVAQGMKFLGMAGFKTNEILSAMPTTLDLATASGMSLKETADILSNIMTGFGVSADKASVATDTLATIATNSNTDIRQLGDAMKYVAPVSKSLGVSMQETAAAIGKLSDAGIQGTLAGTGLRTILSRLINPTKQARDALKQMGLNVHDVDVKSQGLTTVLQRLKSAGLNAKEALAIFGRLGVSAALTLTNSASKMADLTQKANNSTGAVKKMADEMMKSVGNQFKLFSSALTELALKMGDAGLTKSITTMLHAGTDFVTWLGTNKTALDALTESMKLTAKILAGIVAIKAVTFMASLATKTWELVKAQGALNLLLAKAPYAIVAIALGTLAEKLITISDETRKWNHYTKNVTNEYLKMGTVHKKVALQIRMDNLRMAKEEIGNLNDVNAKIANIERQRQARLKRQSHEDPRYKLIQGRNDPGTFRNIMSTSEYRELAILNKKKQSILDIDNKINSLSHDIANLNRQTFADNVKLGAEKAFGSVQKLTTAIVHSTQTANAVKVANQNKSFWNITEPTTSPVQHKTKSFWGTADTATSSLKEYQTHLKATTDKVHQLTKAELEAQYKAQQAQFAQQQWTNSLSGAFKSAILNSKTLGDALGNLANRLENMLVNKALDSLLGGLFGGFANGGAFKNGSLTAYASGGVVSKPTMFPMANGNVGLMGEAGAEAVMPLKRTSSGKLGVIAQGGSGTTVINNSVNISVESSGDKQRDEEHAHTISKAVTEELKGMINRQIIQNKRPGGLLYGG